MLRITIDAYPLSTGLTEALETARSDISLIRSRMQIEPGGIEAAIARHANVGTGDLLLVESEADEAGLLEQLDRLSSVVGPGTNVILVGKVDRIAFYERVLEEGIGKYLLAPPTCGVLLQAISNLFTGTRGGSRGRVIVTFGAKGGVGSSTVAQNLAHSLVKLYDRPVTLMDLDLHFGTVGINLNQMPRAGLRDALSRAIHGDLDEGYMEKLYTREKDDSLLWLLASPPTMQDMSEVLTMDALERVMEVAAGMADFVVVDMPSTWNPVTANFLAMADETILVSDATVQGLQNCQLIYDALKSSKPHNTFLRYVINHVGIFPDGETTAKDFQDALGAANIGEFTWQPTVFRASSGFGKPIGAATGSKNVKVATIFDKMAEVISGRKGEGKKKPPPPKSLFGGLFSSAKG